MPLSHCQHKGKQLFLICRDMEIFAPQSLAEKCQQMPFLRKHNTNAFSRGITLNNKSFSEVW